MKSILTNISTISQNVLKKQIFKYKSLAGIGIGKYSMDEMGKYSIYTIETDLFPRKFSRNTPNTKDVHKDFVSRYEEISSTLNVNDTPEELVFPINTSTMELVLPPQPKKNHYFLDFSAFDYNINKFKNKNFELMMDTPISVISDNHEWSFKFFQDIQAITNKLYKFEEPYKFIDFIQPVGNIKKPRMQVFSEKKMFSTYFERFVDYVAPMTNKEIKEESWKESVFSALTDQFNPQGTSLFVLKSKYIAVVFDWIYICAVAPEMFCLIFALYNVCKAASLYYYYSQHTKEISHIITPRLHRGISYKMLSTLIAQLYFILFLFINPVIFDRAMVMFTGLLMSHGFISLFKVFSVVFFIIILKYVKTYFGYFSHIVAVETYCLISFMVLFTLMLFASNNLILTLVLFEALFFCLIPLMASAYLQNEKKWNFNYELRLTHSNYCQILSYYNRIKPTTNLYASLSVYGTIQYFIYNAFFLGIYIFALTFLFFFSRSFSYYELANILAQGSSYGYSYMLAFCFFCILSMICFKIGIVPYHGWMLAIFSNVNIIPLMLLLLPFKLAIFSTGLRLCYGVLHPYLYILQPFLFMMAFISMIFGAFGMFVQLDIRKFLLFSTINNSGYILLGMCSGTILGIKATLLYIIIYLITTLGFLIFIGSTLNVRTKKPLTNFLELASCSNLKMFPFIVFFVILLSMAGIPPFAGFWAKLFVIDALYSFGFIGWIGILVIILTSTLTVIGYIRVVKFFFIEHTITTTIMVRKYSRFSTRVLKFVLGFLIFFFVFYFSYYYFYRDVDFKKIYSFFRLVL